MHKQLEANIWKFFVYSLTERRHAIPLVSLFFLTLPNTTAQQIGIYTGIGALCSFLFEIPSGYVSDRFGHKRTLVLAKVLMIFSSLFFIFADLLIDFIFGTAFFTISFAFVSGTNAAFMHDTLIALRRDGDYSRIMSRMNGWVSFVSAFLIIALPFLTTISMQLPFVIMLVFDIIGLVVALMLFSPPQVAETEEVNTSNVVSVIRTGAKPGFLAAALFSGAISGFLIADGAYRYPYLHELGYPVAFIGFVMGMSRFVWFVLGYKVHLLRRLSLRSWLRFELLLFPLTFFAVATLTDPYVTGALYSLIIGYFWARREVVTHYFLEHFIKSKRYKATILSVKSQLSNIFEIFVAFFVGFLMQRSFKLGFYTMGAVLFVWLCSVYWYMSRRGYLDRA